MSKIYVLIAYLRLVCSFILLKINILFLLVNVDCICVAFVDYWCCSVFCPGFLSVWKSNLTNCFVYKCA